MHDSVSACYEARIRSLQAFLCSNACEPPAPGAARVPVMASASCGWHSAGSVASSVGTLAEQQAVAAAVQVGVSFLQGGDQANAFAACMHAEAVAADVAGGNRGN